MRMQLAILLTLTAACAGVATGETIVFQNGLNGYAGTVDRRINLVSGANGADVDTTASSFYIDGDPEDPARTDGLFRFDNIVGGSGIPAGATILSATLDLRTTSQAVSSASQSGEAYNVYRLLQPFDGNSTLDGDFGNGDTEFTEYVDGVEPEQGEADWILGTFDHEIGSSPMAFDTTYSADVTRAVQSWVNGAANHGLAVVSDHRDEDDGWSVHSSGSSDASARPSLTVTYTTDPTYRLYELQQGFDGYGGVTDLLMNFLQSSNGTDERDDDTVVGGVDGSTTEEVFVDGSDGARSYDTPYLVHFDTSSVEGSIVKAELLLTTGFSSGASNSPGPFTAHQLLTPFDTSSEYADFAGDAAAMELAGEIAPSAATIEDIEESEYMRVDVTSIVNNWLNGEANYGIYIGAGTTDGWQIFTTGAADLDLSPMLRIYTTVPEPAALALLALAGLAPLRRR